MIKATKIKMKNGKHDSNILTEIDSIYLEGVSENGFYTKEAVHDFLSNDPNTEIKVNISPYPKLIPVKNNNEKYVRSESNDTTKDNLLNLPRE
ncbi:DUF3892 domain-containing protein [Paenibacillus sp. CFBP13512]|uniref:DUF3892 domain-containing protein n=1 Tax=Paenibacillus sp. CFBP13512 TaxID=2184007 RepID=UPI0019D51332|nr:DUF3892 domain-containing protein [Paenibacillus sp. CFBP13512]